MSEMTRIAALMLVFILSGLAPGAVGAQHGAESAETDRQEKAEPKPEAKSSVTRH